MFLLPLIQAFGDTSNIASFRACLFTHIHLNHRYTKHHNDHSDYNANIDWIGDEDEREDYNYIYFDQRYFA